MTDMENKDREQEEAVQVQDSGKEAQEPLEAGDAAGAADDGGEDGSPVTEPQKAPDGDDAPPVEEPAGDAREGDWRDVASHSHGGEPVWAIPAQNPWAEGGAPVPPPAPPAGGGAPVWPGQPVYGAARGQEAQTGEIPLHTDGAVPPVWPGQTPYTAGQTPPAAPYGQAYYGGYPGAGYYGGYPQQGAQQPGAAGGQGGPYAGYYAGYPPYGAGYPQQAQQPEPVKKKKPVGLKVLLWIVSILVVGTLIGFGVYAAVVLRDGGDGSGPHYPMLPDVSEAEPAPSLPEEGGPGGDAPPEEEQEPEDLPNVDVTPNVDGIQLQPRPKGEPLEPKELYDQVVQSTVGITATLARSGQTAESRGTGIIATEDGYIITNAHVVLSSKSARVKVSAYDGQEYDAVVVGVDRTTDLAVIKTNDHGFTPAVFGDAEELSMGEWVMALGNPGGSKYANSLTRGIVSGLNREAGQYSVGGMTYIQTDAAINPGNSGGPLVNMYGQVVGINSSKIVTENYEGMGFAIPVSEAQPIINELLSGGYIKGRTRLGIMIQEIDASTSMMLQVPVGLRITQINDDSAFLGTQAQVNDIITALDGEAVATLRDVSNLLTNYAPGDNVEVTLYRPDSEQAGEGRELTVTVTLLEDKGETQE